MLLGTALLVFPPSRYGAFYPQCPIHQYLHLLCPGCGGTRALAALLRGHWREAFNLNPLITLLVPTSIAAWSIKRLLPKFETPASLRPLVLPAALGAILIFGIARNLPFFPR